VSRPDDASVPAADPAAETFDAAQGPHPHRPLMLSWPCQASSPTTTRTPAVTACRLEITDVETVLSWAAFDQMAQAEKASVTPLWESRVCGKCNYEPKSCRATWAANPVLVVAKSPPRLAFAELRALAASPLPTPTSSPDSSKPSRSSSPWAGCNHGRPAA
jgi:hypothetical protein